MSAIINLVLFKNVLLTFLFLILSILTIAFVLNFGGIEIDNQKKLIRDYKSFLGYRYGQWNNIQDFNIIHITRDKLIVATSIYSEHRSDTFHYYYVVVADDANQRQIILAEYDNYYKAKKLAYVLSEKTGKGVIDFVKGNSKSHK